MSSTSKTSFFMTGVTGYIGGAVLVRFLRHPEFKSFSITALVRSSKKAEKLKTLGINAVVGSHSDLQLIEKLASEAEFIFAMANADHMTAAQAILRGMKNRFETTGIAPKFINTSETSVLIDAAAGQYATDVIYDDADPEQIETLAPTQPHRDVDSEILNADKQGYAKTYIILPSMVYGIAQGKLVDTGIQNPYSIQIPALIRASLDRGNGGMIGQGKNIWANAHIEELGDLYLALYKSIVTNPATGHGREGIYFGENGECNLYDVGKAIGQALVDLGKAKSAEPTTFTKEEIDKYLRGCYLDSNSRCKANRSRSIGWNPVKTPATCSPASNPK
ncbi:hypothetical protein BD779DRAFT_674409 [Infundibulicybe gibba]|nr:hypothetical protein BD779DRAFT_674409 [Infundibulicybe gibba]